MSDHSVSSRSENESLPWLEKYRPRQMEEVVGNIEAIIQLTNLISGSDPRLPDLLLTGPPGVGKTSAIQCLARQRFADLSSRQFQRTVLELNASDERGIMVVRESITQFAQQKNTLRGGRVKLLILDEADNMTEGAQQALRGLMDQYKSNFSVALLCNQSPKIIEGIQSRCAVLRFVPPTSEEMRYRLQQIITKEGVQIEAPALEAILSTCDGDMRQAINNLSSCHAMMHDSSRPISYSDVFRIVDRPCPETVGQMIQLVVKGPREPGGLKKACTLMSELLDKGYNSHDIVQTMILCIRTRPLHTFSSTTNSSARQRSLTDLERLRCAREMSTSLSLIQKGLHSAVQMHSLLARMARLFLIRS